MFSEDEKDVLGRIYTLGKNIHLIYSLFPPQISRNNSKETIFGQDRNLWDKENRREKTKTMQYWKQESRSDW